MRDEQHCEGMNSGISPGMISKRKEANNTKKDLCPVFREGTFRSKSREETDEVILFAVNAHLSGTLFLALPVLLFYASAIHTEHCSFYTVVLCWEGCDPLQPIQPPHIFYVPSSVPGPVLGSPWQWIRSSLCLQSIQRPEGEVVKLPVLTSALPEVGSGGSGSMKGGHIIEARATGVGKDS